MLSSFGPLSLPAPVFWGVLAAWIPIPPAVMAGVLCAVLVYVCFSSFVNSWEWKAEPAPQPELQPALV